jgi:MoxR-like ATPase
MEPARIGKQAGVPKGLSPLHLEGDAPAWPAAVDLETAMALGQRLVANLAQVLLGARETLTAAAVATLCGGHLLIEDVPGVGKTVLARALAVSLGAELSRIQGHADLLPSDVTGVSVFAPDTSTWEFRPGPVFSHLVLVDELNRTPPRTQSALLETMEEQQVTVDGEAWALPRPHLVIATQNPLSQRGTYPLVESQLDRFAVATAIGYPDRDDETQLVLHRGGKFALNDLQPVCTTDHWAQVQAATESVPVSEPVADYAVELCRATRAASGVRLGASPRAAIWLIRCAQAHALLWGRAFVAPDDVKAVAVGCLAHRLVLADSDDGLEHAAVVVRSLLEATPSPRP